MSHDLLKRVERASIRALPALEEHVLEGWLLRYANGHARRANSVQALEYRGGDVIDTLAVVEDWYGERDLPATFRLTAGSQPSHLDAALEERGWTRHGTVSVQVLDLAGRGFEPADGVELTESPTEPWFETLTAGNEEMAERRSTLQLMLSRLEAEPIYALARDPAGAPVATGLGVIDGELIGMFSFATAPAARRQGYATAATATLLATATDRGITTSYLQVFAGNEPAKALYRNLGFEELYEYWYRTQPSPDSSVDARPPPREV